MKNIFSVFLSIFFLLSIKATAQKEMNIWYFGTDAGLDFNTGSPPTVLTNGIINTTEGCATLSDKNGNLLFYTDGTVVMNKNHVQMPNGFALKGGSSASQSAIIVPKPGSSTLFYVFTVAVGAAVDGINYSIVDMTMDAGLGDVTTKNVFLYPYAAERITAVKHANGCDYWVVTHDHLNKQFKVFEVTSAGVNLTPFISAAGPTNFKFPGCMKISPDGKKMAVAGYMNKFGLYDFNNANGALSNPIILDVPPGIFSYGVEFSPDMTYLYGAGGNTTPIGQYDLTAGSAAAINASLVVIGNMSASDVGAMQMGPDGKIYIARLGNTYLGIIDSPNSLGAAANLISNGIYLGGKLSRWGLPNFIPPYFPSIVSTSNCLAGTFFSTDTVGSLAMKWNFGDPASGVANTSNQYVATHTFSSAGTYPIQAVIYRSCKNDTVKSSVTVVACNSPLAILSVDGTTSCANTSDGSATVNITAGTPTYSYTWSTGATAITTATTSTQNNLAVGVYTVTITDAVSSLLITTVSVTQPPAISFNATQQSPAACGNNNGVAIASATGGNGGFVYTWNTGATSVTESMLFSGTYTLTVTDVGSCSATTTVIINDSPAPSVTNILGSALSCNGDINGTASVSATGVGTLNYTWSNGAIGTTQTSISNLSANIYYVTVTDGNNCKTITSATVTEPSLLMLAIPIVNPANCNQSNGTAQLGLSGGTGPNYSYNWISGQTTTTSQQYIITNLQQGSYVVTVTDNNGCVQTTTAVIPNINGVNIQGTTTSNPLCNNVSDGTATLVTTGGVAPFDYVFSNGSTGSTNSTTHNFTGLSSGNYTVTITDFNNCTTTSSFQLINPAVLSLGTPTIVDEACGAQDGSITLTASGATGTTYYFIWSNGQTANTTQSTITNLQSGSYTVTVSDINNCTATQTVALNNVGSITANAGPTQTICEGETVQLNGTGGTTYSWSPINTLTNPNINNPIATPTTTTQYTLTAQSGTCTDTDVITLTVNSIPIITITSNQTIVSGSSIQLTATGGNTYSWMPNTTIDNSLTNSPIVNPTQTTTYTVIVTSAAGCTNTEMVTVTVTPLQVKTCADNESEEFIANVFSPNGDGKNDVLNVMGNGLINISFLIFDRWGNVVFETNDQAVGWDGSYKNQAMNNGTYVFYLKATCLTTGKELIQKGNVSIVK